MAVVALLACGSADAQSMLGRLADRAKNAAEIYTWNGYTMKLVMNGKVVYEVVGYTELVPESAFTRTLDVNWL